MTVEQSLQQFYLDNSLPDNGGENKDFFELGIKPFTVKLPNPEFRKKVIHIHDIEHVLYNRDISWKGESFIAGWAGQTLLTFFLNFRNKNLFKKLFLVFFIPKI